MLKFPLVEEGVVPKLAKVAFAPLIVKVLSGIVPPMVPLTVTLPVPADNVRFLPVVSALMVPVTVMSPAPDPEERVTLLVVVLTIFPEMVIALFVVVILAPILAVPVSATVDVVVMATGCEMVAAVADRQFKGVVPPTMPLNWTVPVPVDTVKQ